MPYTLYFLLMDNFVTQYVASIIKLRSAPFKKSKKVKSATKKEIQSMLTLCINNLDEIDFFRPKEKRPIMLENLRNIFYKWTYQIKKRVFYLVYLQV